MTAYRKLILLPPRTHILSNSQYLYGVNMQVPSEYATHVKVINCATIHALLLLERHRLVYFIL